MMQKLFRPLVVVLALTVPVLAQWSYKDTLPEVTVSGTAGRVFTDAQVLSGNGHPQADVATCSVTGANIRVTTDGSDPTTTLGEVVVPGNYTWAGNDVLQALRAIRDDSTSATMNCTVYGGGGR